MVKNNVVDTAKMRRPDFASGAFDPSGRVARDDRGNAVWQWSQDNEVLPVHLAHPGFTLAEDAPSPVGAVMLNKTATKTGYNPYESGLIQKQGVRRKRDLRELSRLIELKRATGGARGE